MGQLASIIYVSQETTPFTSERLNELARKSSAHNEAYGITGYLWYRRGQFTQFIEGGEHELRELMARIENDPRHTVLYRLDRKGGAERVCANWSMRLLTDTSSHEIDMFESLETNLSSVMRVLESLTRLEEGIWKLVESVPRKF